MTKQDFLKSIPTFKEVTAVFAQATRMPMVFCHPETMDDYIYVYLQEEAAREKAQALADGGAPAFVVRCQEKEVLPFFAELRLTGINAICFVAEDGQEILVQLTDFLRFPDMSSFPEDKRPVENPSLQLSMLYFMQETRKPRTQVTGERMAELEEEASANLFRGRFMIPLRDEEQEDSNRKSVLMLQNDKGETFLPLFTDGAEIRRFMKGKPCPVINVGFDGVCELLKKGSNTAGILLNAATSAVALSRAGVEAFDKRFR